jgi:hypothetical protein
MNSNIINPRNSGGPRRSLNMGKKLSIQIDKLPNIHRNGRVGTVVSTEHNRSSSDYVETMSHVFVGEKLRFSKKYLKDDISPTKRTKKIKNHVMSLLLNNKQEPEAKNEHYLNYIVQNLKNEQPSPKMNVRLFRDYASIDLPVTGHHIRSEDPYFIINSRKHGTFLNNPRFMDNIFEKNISKLAVRFNTEI